MASEWQESCLGEVARFRAGSAFKPEHQGQVSGDIPFIKVSDLNLTGNEHAIHHANNWISRDLAREIKATIHPTGATVFAKIGIALTYNRRRLLIRDTAIDNNMMSAIPDDSVISPRYLYFLLQKIDFNEVAHGSALPYLNVSDLQKIEFELPPLEEQRAIAETLGALDDRIDNLRQTNTTLEAIAAALFKSWFVDFDGVGQEDMQESELGMIPKGWMVRSLDSIANYLNGLALQKFPPENETEFLPVIKIAQLRAGHTNGADRAGTRLKPEYIVDDGDVLFSWSGSLEVEVWTGGRGALNQHLFKVTSHEVPKWFYYFATRQHLPDFRIIAAGKATTMGHIQRGHLTAAKVAVPSPDEMAKFDAIIAPPFGQKTSNALLVRTLSALRDTLLPHLISGRLRVTEVVDSAENG